MSNTQIVVETALRWAVPVFLAALTALFVRKWGTVRRWRRERKAHNAALHSMVGSWADFSCSMTTNVHDLQAKHSSMAAQVRKLTDDIWARMDTQDKVLATVLAMTRGQFETSQAAMFVCDGTGQNADVNAAYAAMLGVGRDELMGLRWRSFIPSEQMPGYLARFESANHDHRLFDDEVSMRTRSGETLTFRVRMIPFPPNVGPATHWVGTLTVVGSP